MNIPSDIKTVVRSGVQGLPSGPRSRWFTVPVRVDGPRARLFGFPYSGAGASAFFPWSKGLARHGIEVWNVQYPGRENRIAEPPIVHFTAFLRALVEVFDEVPGDVPFAFFGHSLGAVIAHALACELHRLGRATPAHLFLSGRNAPHVRREPSRIHELPDPELIDAVARFGNLPESFRNEPELMGLLIPVLRADFTLLHDYLQTRPPTEEVLMHTCPFSVFGGEGDPWTTRRGLSDWGHYTSGRFRLRTYPGDHFFLNESRERLWRALRDDLETSPAAGLGRPFETGLRVGAL